MKPLPTPPASPANIVPLRPAEAEVVEPVYDGDGAVAGYVINDQFFPALRPASTFPSLPTSQAAEQLLKQGRAALHALQIARIDAHFAIDLDYRDQILGSVRAGLTKFETNLDHNRTRGEILASIRDGVQLVAATATAATAAMFDTYAAKGQMIWGDDLYQRQRARIERETRFAMEWSLEGQANAHALAMQRQIGVDERQGEETKVSGAIAQQLSKQEHEVTLAVLAAGQQLPEMLAEIGRLQSTNPEAVTGALMSALQLATTQYQQIVATADPAARKQLAEQFRPLLATVLNQSIAAIKGAGQGGAK